MKYIKRGFVHFISFCENNCALRAVRNGFTIMLPLVFIHFFSLVILNFPIEGYLNWIQSDQAAGFYNFINSIFDISGCYFSFLLTIAIGWSYAREKKMHTFQSVILALTCILSFLTFAGFNTSDFDSNFLDFAGIFTSLFSCIVTCPVYILLLNLILKQPRKNRKRLDHILRDSMEAIIPMLGIIILCAVLQKLIMYITGGICIQHAAANVIASIIVSAGGSSLAASIIYTLFVQIAWFFGINGDNLLSDIVSNCNFELLKQNMEAAASGAAPTNIFNSLFYNTFCIFGGSGCILALLIAILIFSKNKSSKVIAKMSVVPTIFNISELISFGIPVVLNPIFLIPFIAAPIANSIIAYFATAIGFIPVLATDISWITPIFFSGYMATGSVTGIILQAVLLAIDCAIYYPFIRMNDLKHKRIFIQNVRDLEQELRKCEEANYKVDFNSMEPSLSSTADVLIEELRNDLNTDKVFMLYQPQFNSDNNFIGAEALIRWKHPTAGFIYPPLIIVLAKEGGFLNKLEEFIFDETCSSIKKLCETYKGCKYKISANITADSLKFDGFEDIVETAVQKYNIPHELLWIELTEHDAISGTNEVIQKLERLKAKGHKLLIDDFGMGHTSINYLQTNLFDIVKLDGSITRDVINSSRDQEIVSSLTSLSKALNIDVVAEYVENTNQRDKLLDLGCDIFQGYLYSKPVPIKDIYNMADKKAP